MNKYILQILSVIFISLFLFSGCPGIINETKMEIFASVNGGKVHVAQIIAKIPTCQTYPACAGACALCGGCGPHDQLHYAIRFGIEPRSELIRGCPMIGFKPLQGNGMCNVGEIIFGLAQDTTMGKIIAADAPNFYCGTQ